MTKLLPDIYVRAGWRNTTPLDPISDRIGLGFNTQNGVIRIQIDSEHAQRLVDSVSEALKGYPLMRSQSPRSEGKPNLEGSPQDGQ